jgi:hypothetical protein
MDQPVPQITIPAFPETTMNGIKQQLMPRIMECSRGGFIVLFDGKGVASRSTWGEVINCIEELGYEEMGVQRPEPVIPEGIDPTVQGEPHHPKETTLHSTFLWAATVVITALAAFSIRSV